MHRVLMHNSNFKMKIQLKNFWFVLFRRFFFFNCLKIFWHRYKSDTAMQNLGCLKGNNIILNDKNCLTQWHPNMDIVESAYKANNPQQNTREWGNLRRQVNNFNNDIEIFTREPRRWRNVHTYRSEGLYLWFLINKETKAITPAKVRIQIKKGMILSKIHCFTFYWAISINGHSPCFSSFY